MEGKILWTPTEQTRQNANLTKYMHWLNEKYGWYFETYDELWAWSVNDVETFWKTIWTYFDIKHSGSIDTILGGDSFQTSKWFSGTKVNYAEHIFRHRNSSIPALIFKSETQPLIEISWATLTEQVASLAAFLRAQGVEAGDRVAGYLPNIPEATIGFLAANTIGAVWSSASPDFGTDAVLERFGQIEPKVLIAVNGYNYGGKAFDKTQTVTDLAAAMPSVQAVVWVNYLPTIAIPKAPTFIHFSQILTKYADAPLHFTRCDFNAPMWILYSSGTTGKPKSITHSQGGMLLEHLKYVTFHTDIQRGERFFWYTTTGWMMWNFVQAALLGGATAVLYDGSPAFPDINVLWAFAADAKMAHFGTSAAYINSCMKLGANPQQFDLSAMRGLGSTGSPLVAEGFDWIYKNVKSDIWLTSMSGGTDVCTAFVGGCPLEAVRQGEIQRRALGCAMESWDENGNPLENSVGEMVITKPMPCMPIYFWNDADGSQYHAAYFDVFPNVWRHGDWLRFTESGGLQILGRSDSTLNRQGIRIGTSEIYRAVESLDFIADSLVVNLEKSDGDDGLMPLFVVLKNNAALTDDHRRQINQTLRQTYSPRHVPDLIVQVSEIPYTISGKKLEIPVKKLLTGKITDAAQLNLGAVRNPTALLAFRELKLL